MTKKVCISFLGNANHDSRITNLSASLRNDGFDVSIIAFDWRTIDEDQVSENVKIFKLKRSGTNLFFYLSFSVKLLKELFKSRAKIFFAEDIYTLPFVTLAAKIKKGKIIYNSRELYAFIGGLTRRHLLQETIKTIESFFIKRVDLILTTGEMDTAFIRDFYKVNNLLTIRNIPMLQKPNKKVDLRSKYKIPNDKIILLYQGVIIGGRGIKLLLEAMTELPQTVLVLFGDGEEKESFQLHACELKLETRVIFAGTVDQQELINYTCEGDIGAALIENISVSYYHALPNKLFEYIMAGIPVLSSDLPQMKNIVEKYKVGKAININEKKNVVNALKEMIENKELFGAYKANCAKAALELNWQKEFEKAKPVLYSVFEK